MSQTVLGLSIGQITAYAAIANVLLALVLAVVTLYYASHAKRQADASKEQVDASNRQADAAIRTLELLLREKEQQAKTDVFTVKFQLRAAAQMIDEWQQRIHSESPDLPDVIEILPPNFNSTISNAERIDHLVAGYMGSALHFVTKAELDIRVLRDRDPGLSADTAVIHGKLIESRARLKERADKNLATARAKIAEASARLEAATGGSAATAS
jgi:light-regulated signal transduction histidine kinase (bacteriophytochrome)